MKRNFSQIVEEYFSLYKGNFNFALAKKDLRKHRLKRFLEVSIQFILIIAIFIGGFKFGKDIIKLNSASGGENSFGMRPSFLYSVTYDSLEEMWLDAGRTFRYFDFKFIEEDLTITSFNITYYKRTNDIHSIVATYIIDGKCLTKVNFSVSRIKLEGMVSENFYNKIILYNDLKLYKVINNGDISNINYHFYENGLSYTISCSLNIFNIGMNDQEILDIILGNNLDETAKLPDIGEEDPFPGDDDLFPGDEIDLP